MNDVAAVHLIQAPRNVHGYLSAPGMSLRMSQFSQDWCSTCTAQHWHGLAMLCKGAMQRADASIFTVKQNCQASTTSAAHVP